MTIYIIDEWVRIETDYNTWKFDLDELDQIQDVVDNYNNEDDVEIKNDGYRQGYVNNENVYDYLYEWTLDE